MKFSSSCLEVFQPSYRSLRPDPALLGLYFHNAERPVQISTPPFATLQLKARHTPRDVGGHEKFSETCVTIETAWNEDT